MRRLTTIGLNWKVLLSYYDAAAESLLRYGIAARFGNLTVQAKAQVNILINTAMKVMEVSQHPRFQKILFNKS